MRPLTQEDLIPQRDYERQRDSFRRRIIEMKQRRRISVGEQVTLIFENRDTIQFQIQEMIRVEHIFDPVKVQDELDIYNALLPAEGELSATLFIEITESDRIKQDLDSFQGIDRGKSVALAAGPFKVFGEFEGGHSKEDKISAVHFVRFRPTRDFVEALLGARQAASILVDHAAYKAEAPVSEELWREWLEDLGLPTASKTGA
ncbi:MAG: DUF3501 family protein [Nitrospira sp.]|nr:DUF3501 family protein [Nitrospira sp.]